MTKATPPKATAAVIAKPRASHAKKVTMDKTTMSAHEKVEVKRIVPGKASETKLVKTGRKSARQLNNEQRAQLAKTTKVENSAVNSATETDPGVLPAAFESTRASGLPFELPKEESNVDLSKLGAPNLSWKEMATANSATTTGFSRSNTLKTAKPNRPVFQSSPIQMTQVGFEMLNGFAFLNGDFVLSETPRAVGIQQRLETLAMLHRKLQESTEHSYQPVDLSKIAEPDFHEMSNPWFVKNDGEEYFDHVSLLSAKLAHIRAIYESLSDWNFEGMEIDKIASKAFFHNEDQESLSSLHLPFPPKGKEREEKLYTVICFMRVANKIKRSLSFDLNSKNFKPYFFVEPEPLPYFVTQKERFTAEFKSHMESLRMMLDNIECQTNIIDAELRQFCASMAHAKRQYEFLKAQEKEAAKKA